MQRPADLDTRGIEKSKRSWKVLSFFEEVPLSSCDCRSAVFNVLPQVQGKTREYLSQESTISQ